jgi:hypothetical protein
MNNKRYQILITGKGPASTGNPQTDADLLLQTLLQTMQANGHTITTGHITVNGLKIQLVSNPPDNAPLPVEQPPGTADAILHRIDTNVQAILERLPKASDPKPLKSPKSPRKKEGGASEEKPPQPGNDTPSPTNPPEGTPPDHDETEEDNGILTSPAEPGRQKKEPPR